MFLNIATNKLPSVIFKTVSLLPSNYYVQVLFEIYYPLRLLIVDTVILVLAHSIHEVDLFMDLCTFVEAWYIFMIYTLAQHRIS